MRKIACFVFEIEEGENYDDVIRQLFEDGKLKNIQVKTYEDFKKQPKGLDWKQRFDIVLSKFGVTEMYKGYNTLYEIMALLYENPKLRKSVCCKEIYNGVFQKTGVNAAQAERQVRTVIDKIYTNVSEDVVKETLNIPKECTARLIPKYFISLLSKKIF